MFRRTKNRATSSTPPPPLVVGDYSGVTVSAELVPYIEELEQVSCDLRALHDRLLRAEEEERAARRRQSSPRTAT